MLDNAVRGSSLTCTFPLGAGYSQRVPHWRCQPEGQQPHEEIIKVLRPFFLLQLHPLIYVSVWFPSSHMQWCHFVIGRWCLNDASCACVVTQCICSFSGNPCSHCAPALGALMRPWGNLGSCSSSSSSRESTVNKILTPNKCGFRRLNLRNHKEKKKQNTIVYFVMALKSKVSHFPQTAGYQTMCEQ